MPVMAELRQALPSWAAFSSRVISASSSEMRSARESRGSVHGRVPSRVWSSGAGIGGLRGAVRGGGLADDQRGSQLDAMAGGLLPGRELHEDLRGGASHVGEGLVDGGQRRACPSRGGGVVEADDAQLTGYRDARHPGGLQDAECLDVTAGEDRGRPVWQCEQAECVLVA